MGGIPIHAYMRRLWARLSAQFTTCRTRQQLYLERWRKLPEHLRTPQQVAGISSVSCGATHSIMEKCNFACTSCYLSEVANYTKPLPFAKVQAQLDALRHYLGTGGKVQITSGEVTLLPKDELGKIVAYAKEIGLDPMVMTNGQRLLQVPDYLSTLVGQYGLEKIGLHIDTTQKGRPDMPQGLAERDIHPLRDRFARLLKDVRKKTGKSLHAGHTVTVTGQNFDDIPDVVRWVLDNVDSFRIISFLPVAQVGRTQDRRVEHLGLETVWEKICEGAGRPLNRHAMHFGHTQCNITVPLLVVSFGEGHHLVEVVRQEEQWDLRFFRRALRKFGPHVDFNLVWWRHVLKLFLPVLRNPDMVVELPFYALYRLWGLRRWLGRLAWYWARGRKVRIRPLLIVVHKFMSPDELETPLGRERLEACVFKLPVDGGMVSMCQMNATPLRRELNLHSVR